MAPKQDPQGDPKPPPGMQKPHEPHEMELPLDACERIRPTTEERELTVEEQLEEALLDSFPASDPPSAGR